MAHTELGLRERRTIEDMLNAKMSVGQDCWLRSADIAQPCTERSNGTGLSTTNCQS